MRSKNMYSFKIDKENYLLDSAFVNRKLVLKKLGDYINNLSKTLEVVKEKPDSWKSWFVSSFNFSKPDKSKCRECIEKLGTILGQLSETLVDPAQFGTYLDVFIQFATTTTSFQGTPAETIFANLIFYLNYGLEKDLKQAQTSSIEIPEIKSDSSNSCP